MSFNIQYKEYTCFQTESEWINVIVTALRRIESTHVGSLLISELNKYVKMGYSVNIVNYAPNKSFQYPHFKYSENDQIYDNTIVIPDTPYFIEVEVFNQDLIEGIECQLFDKIINCQPLDSKLDNDFCSSFSIFKFQPIVVTLFHELVHCLRHLNKIKLNTQLEEESTIYGITNHTLIINDLIITENTFRKEIGLGPRISHDSKDLFVYNSTRTKCENQDKGNFSKSFLKKLFLKEDFD